jgi:TatD DNase family protein
MILTDTHTHLYSKEFDKDREEVLQRAAEHDVRRFFIPAIDSSHTAAMYSLEQQDPENIFLMMGLHPSSVDENYEKELQHVEEELGKRKFYAVGEIGIDLYWEKKYLNQQQDAFKRQIQLAKKYELPIVIHCREAFDEIFEVLETERDEKLFGIFHCFTGNLEQAKRAISFNMKLGIGGW